MGAAQTPDYPVSPEQGPMAPGPDACREGGAVRGQALCREPAVASHSEKAVETRLLIFCVFFSAFHSEYII